MTLREQLAYGDDGTPDQSEPERIANQSLNLLGKLHRHYDEAGLLAFPAYDFKGNVLEKSRQVIGDDPILAVFDSPPEDWRIQAFRVDWQPEGMSPEERAANLLDPTPYETSFAYDALNRIQTMRYPRDVDGERKALRPAYNRAGALESITLDEETYVERIAYNAKGQRVLVAYGNGVMTRYAYYAQTFRLARLRAERFAKQEEIVYQPDGGLLQDFVYTYDLAGNITTITDRTPGCGVHDNPEAGLITEPALRLLATAGHALLRRFEYDPLYRLRSATGRECNDIPSPRPWSDEQRCGFNSGPHGTTNQDNAPHLTRVYAETYDYDAVGNMTTLSHRNGDAWTRHFGMGGLAPPEWDAEWRSRVVDWNGGTRWIQPLNNRLTRVGDNAPSTPQTHFFDINGNLIRETTSRHFEWDHSDRMRVFRNQTNGREPTVHAHYLYDAAGKRVKSLVRKQNGQPTEVTIHVDAVFEHHRVTEAGATQENDSLHVMDGQNRIALVRVGESFSDDGTPAVKYHLGDHLGSSNVDVGGDIANANDFINREEFFPYGETSFGSFARKRYRFTGKQRDEESGLSYHGARYYAPWIGRWLSCDPIGPLGSANLYTYVRNSPLKFIDPSGNQETMSPEATGLLRAGREHVTSAAIELPMTFLDPLGLRHAAIAYFREGGGWRGAYAAVNEMNPANQFLSPFVETYREGAAMFVDLDRGNNEGAAYHAFNMARNGTVAGESVVMLAVPEVRNNGTTRQPPAAPRSNQPPPATGGRVLRREQLRGWTRLLAEFYAHDVVERTPPGTPLPGAAAVRIDLETGAIKGATSGTRAVRIDPVTGTPLVGERPGIPPEVRSGYGNVLCAEPHLVPSGTPRNVTENLEISVVRVRGNTGEPLPRCARCARRTAGAEVPTD